MGTHGLNRLNRTPSLDTTMESSNISTPSRGGAHSSCGRRRRRKSESSYTKLLCSLFSYSWGSTLLSALPSISVNKIV